MSQRSSLGLAILAAGMVLQGAAIGQTAPQRAYNDGFKLQPRAPEGENRQQTDPAKVEPLLDALARDNQTPAADAPATDIYGRPLGGNPGLNPPGVKPIKQ